MTAPGSGAGDPAGPDEQRDALMRLIAPVMGAWTIDSPYHDRAPREVAEAVIAAGWRPVSASPAATEAELWVNLARLLATRKSEEVTDARACADRLDKMSPEQRTGSMIRGMWQAALGRIAAFDEVAQAVGLTFPVSPSGVSVPGRAAEQGE